MSQLDDFRAEKDEFFGSAHSPLEPGEAFTGLSYFPESDQYRFELRLEPSAGGEVTIGTSDGQTRTYQRAGLVRFSVAGEEAQLTLLHHIGDDGYFLPFRDATTGKTTYGAGRYLDVDEAEDDVVSIDFNFAYNPYCAYSPAYSCPLPPTENWLPMAIEAGEMTYEPATS